jgi:hypothetical protein
MTHGPSRYIPTSATHGGTDYKELEIETVTMMEKLSRRLLFNGDSLAFKSFKMMYLNKAQRGALGRSIQHRSG